MLQALRLPNLTDLLNRASKYKQLIGRWLIMIYDECQGRKGSSLSFFLLLLIRLSLCCKVATRLKCTQQGHKTWYFISLAAIAHRMDGMCARFRQLRNGNDHHQQQHQQHHYTSNDEFATIC